MWTITYFKHPLHIPRRMPIFVKAEQFLSVVLGCLFIVECQTLPNGNETSADTGHAQSGIELPPQNVTLNESPYILILWFFCSYFGRGGINFAIQLSVLLHSFFVHFFALIMLRKC